MGTVGLLLLGGGTLASSENHKTSAPFFFQPCASPSLPKIWSLVPLDPEPFALHVHTG